ncbi:MAG: hypothetical protein OXG65_10470 [Chloroflexi bacterium]|nr:hypothetical protein [Chloroflexota bacterium]
MDDDKDAGVCTRDTRESKNKKDIGPAYDDFLTTILNTPPDDLPRVEPEPDE